MLGAFDIRYLAELTEGMEKDGTKEGGMPDREILVITMSHLLLWELYVDRATNSKGSWIGNV